jgi:hypothetical protein
VDANADMDLLGFFLVAIVSTELRLNLLGTLYGVDHGGKVHQKGVTDGFDDNTMMLSHCLPNDLVMNLQQPQRASFIVAHLATKAHDVGEHDSGQLAGLGRS